MRKTTTMRLVWLPSELTISLRDVTESRRDWNSKIDPNDCPLVRALRRVIPAESWLNIWMYDDYYPQVQSEDGRQFEATISRLDRERFSQFDRKGISPAGRTVKLRWREVDPEQGLHFV
jgi:hypothetical protein